jgi:hypothetical protein
LKIIEINYKKGWIMGLFDALFGGGGGAAGEDIAQAAQQGISTEKDFLAKALGLLEPFRKGGVGALGDLQGIFAQEKDPTAFVNNILSQYQESPGEKFIKEQGIKAGQQAAEASGQQGSGAEQEALAKFATGLASQDQQRFLQNVLGVQQQRTGGLENLFSGGLSAAGQGAGATTSAANAIANLLGQVGKGKAMSDEASAGGLSGLLGDIGGALTGGILGHKGLLGKGIGGGLGSLLGFL